MKFKNYPAVTCLLLSVIVLSVACKKQSDYIVQRSTSSANLLDNELVITPAGRYPKSHVHLIEMGTQLMITNGRVQKINATTGNVLEDYGPVDKQSSLNYIKDHFSQKRSSSSPIPNLNDHWITYAYWTNNGSTPINLLQTTWKVPTAPVSHDNQTLFLFNGFQDAHVGTDIIQPVLQWGVSGAGGGAYWAIASWCIIGTQVYHTGLTTVTAGTSLTGKITLDSYAGNAYNYTVIFTGHAATKLIVSNGAGSNTGGNALPQQRFACHTLEAYNMTKGSDYPADKLDAMTGITLKTGSTYPTITWSVDNTNVDASVGQSTVVVSNNTSGTGEVDIYFHPATVRINGNSYYYFSATQNSGSGYINAVPGTVVNVNAAASGPPPGPYSTYFGMSGANFTDGTTTISVSYPPTYNQTKTFTMPANGYVSWGGNFTEPNDDGSGSVSVN